MPPLKGREKARKRSKNGTINERGKRKQRKGKR
jgi:hypothetical protein